MMACIIINNMIIEDACEEHGEEYEYHFDDEGHYVCNYDDMGSIVTISHNTTIELDAFMQNYINIKDSEIHYQLKADLIKHLWQNHSELYNIY
jgi:hypothetical protein